MNHLDPIANPYKKEGMNTVVVTGSEGFIGRNLCLELLHQGYVVLGIDNMSNTCGYGRLTHDNYSLNVGDVTNKTFMLNTMKQLDPATTSVCHLAAVASVPRSMREPLLYTENNVFGLHVVLEACRLLGIKRIAFASSSSTLGDSNNKIISPYGLSKYQNEQTAELYHRIFGLETIGLRFFNVYGPFQKSGSAYAAVVPVFCNQALQGGNLTIFGDGSQTRSFTYVKDVVDGIICTISSEHDKVKHLYGATVDLGNIRTCSVRDIARFALQITCDSEDPAAVNRRILYGAARKGDIKHSAAKAGEIREAVGWSARVGILEGMTRTIEFYAGVERSEPRVIAR